MIKFLFVLILFSCLFTQIRATCQQGTYIEGSTCVNCSAELYSNTLDATECKTCEEGLYADHQGSTSCSETNACHAAVNTAYDWITSPGVEYDYGGNSPPTLPSTKGKLDCSGLVYHSFKAQGIDTFRTTEYFCRSGDNITGFVEVGCKLPASDNLDCWQKGDVVCVNDGNHVAFYWGDGLFAECASQSTGCVIRDLSWTSAIESWYGTKRPIFAECQTEEPDDSAVSSNWRLQAYFFVLTFTILFAM
ncbi:peptidoglycan dl-endopeptidase cwlo [Anaeramoeba flamelloides]|uniref:Peptidoglycan dl-endopeptidase cwlo n=1 Tax=Anaeramoeba flamelloides TaxID=1746091 RepID=A0AAV7ZC66_9EUKA|nr:peptidoglycan dl-endopeptidase cwlo [Anaeramoeba flamelloides]